MVEELLFTKIVDKSTLYEGISIPVAYQKFLLSKMHFSLEKGSQKNIKVEMCGYIYDDAVIKNQFFD